MGAASDGQVCSWDLARLTHIISLPETVRTEHLDRLLDGEPVRDPKDT
ncbi:hypothetical protein [Arthrobacter ruber]|nr:hypothetical protein [Arthrobacter ruber]